jgi:hypothetical protein
MKQPILFYGDASKTTRIISTNEDKYIRTNEDKYIRTTEDKKY